MKNEEYTVETIHVNVKNSHLVLMNCEKFRFQKSKKKNRQKKKKKKKKNRQKKKKKKWRTTQKNVTIFFRLQKIIVIKKIL